MTLRWVPGWNGLTEPEAVSYVAAVEAADGEPLEFGVAKAINDFVFDCKNDGIWDAIKASCILAGARTLSGALVPLKGVNPISTLAGDYNRKTGVLKSSGVINTNYPANNNSQNNEHVAAYITAGPTSNNRWITTDPNTTQTHFEFFGASAIFRCQSPSGQVGATNSTGFLAVSRSSSSGFNYRIGGSTSFHSNPSAAPGVNPFRLLASTGTPRLSFYSIGESLDLAALDTRVSALITAIGAAIP